MALCTVILSFFCFNDTATTEIYTLSLHDALPISRVALEVSTTIGRRTAVTVPSSGMVTWKSLSTSSSSPSTRSEEHTSELQSRQYLVCRLLLEKKKNEYNYYL